MQQNCLPTRQFLNQLSRFLTTIPKRRLDPIDLMKMYSRMHGYVKSENNYQYVLQQISQQTSPRQLLKYLYLIHGCLQYHNYPPKHLDFLQQTLFPQLTTTNSIQEWLMQVCQSYYNYLIKMSLSKELFEGLSTGKIISKKAVIDTFLIINLLNVFLIQAKQTFNVSGRYYLKVLFEFQDMYDIVRKEFDNMYQHLRKLIRRITDTYASFSTDEMGCFLEAMTEMDLINDNYEEFSKNKYYATENSLALLSLSPIDENTLIQYVLQH